MLRGRAAATPSPRVVTSMMALLASLDILAMAALAMLMWRSMPSSCCISGPIGQPNPCATIALPDDRIAVEIRSLPQLTRKTELQPSSTLRIQCQRCNLSAAITHLPFRNHHWPILGTPASIQVCESTHSKTGSIKQSAGRSFCSFSLLEL